MLRRYSPAQIVLLLLGATLIVTALLLDRNAPSRPYAEPPEIVEWQTLQIAMLDGLALSAIEPEFLVLTSDRAPGARLTLFVRPDERRTPDALVRSLCRRDACTHSTSFPDGSRTDANRAVADYRLGGERFALILLRPGGREIWIEFKGAPSHFSAFETLVDSISGQLKAGPLLEEARARPSSG